MLEILEKNIDISGFACIYIKKQRVIYANKNGYLWGQGGMN